MNNKRNPFERFLQKYAIRNLSLIIIMCYGFGYILQYVNADFLDYLTLNPYAICHGQVWRLLTWVLVPPDTSNIFFILIAMLFYYSIGTALERTWGTVEYNRYIWEGVLITIAGAFVVMGVLYLLYHGQLNAQTAPDYFTAVSRYFSTYYVNMSIFLAYAATFPDAVVLFMFFIPMKVKWLGIIYGAILAYDFVRYAMGGYWFVCVAMAASLANFLLYWLRTRSLRRFAPSEIRRRRDFKRKISEGERQRRSNAAGRGAPGNGTASGTASVHMRPDTRNARHRCCICGRTEIDHPELEFRYCSKCQGNFEFCQDHLFRHVHAADGQPPKLIQDGDPQ